MPRSAVLWHVTMSLDGYIAGPGDDMSRILEHVDPADPGAAGAPERAGAVVAGRRSFDVGRRDGREVFDGAWSGPQFLMTHRPAEGLPAGIAVRSGELAPVIAEAQEAAGERDVLLIGADIARQCVTAGLVHEVLVHIAPVMLGGGVRFRGPEEGASLRLQDQSRHGELVTLRYVVVPEGPVAADPQQGRSRPPRICSPTATHPAPTRGRAHPSA